MTVLGFRASWASVRLGLPCVLAIAASGCHSLSTTPSAPSKQVSSTLAAQQSPVYRRSVVQFSRHDYASALAGINSLLAQPQYFQSQADHLFLLHQQAICRHAIDPHVAADLPPAPPAPVILTHAPVTAAQADCGPRALLLLCPNLGIHTNLDTLRQKAGTTAKGTTLEGLAQAAQAVGLKAKGVQVDKQALAQVPLPAIAWYDGSHYVDLLAANEQQVTIRDPNKPNKEDISTNELLGRSGGILLTLSR